MNIESKVTVRGFRLKEFYDLYDCKCSIQKSSLATEDAIWVGISKPEPIILAKNLRDDLTGWVKYPLPDEVEITTRMHLSIDQVKELIPILQEFVDTGDI